MTKNFLNSKNNIYSKIKCKLKLNHKLYGNI